MLNLSKYLKLILITGTVISIVPLSLFLLNFTNQTLSREIIDWGSFGDYLSGTIGILINLINLSILILLTLYVAKLDMHRHYNEFRYESYLKLCDKFDSIFDNSRSYTDLLEYISNFTCRNSFVYSSKEYESLIKISEKLKESIKSIIEILRKREKGISDGSIIEYKVGETFFTDLLAESIIEREYMNNPDLLAFEEMKMQRDILLIFIQDKMKGKKTNTSTQQVV